jgi:hypothetical protein
MLLCPQIGFQGLRSQSSIHIDICSIICCTRFRQPKLLRLLHDKSLIKVANWISVQISSDSHFKLVGLRRKIGGRKDVPWRKVIKAQTNLINVVTSRPIWTVRIVIVGPTPIYVGCPFHFGSSSTNQACHATKRCDVHSGIVWSRPSWIPISIHLWSDL